MVPSGVLHGPGTALTLELQEDSDVLSMFQALNAGRIIDKELLYKDVRPADRDRARPSGRRWGSSTGTATATRICSPGPPRAGAALRLDRRRPAGLGLLRQPASSAGSG